MSKFKVSTGDQSQFINDRGLQVIAHLLSQAIEAENKIPQMADFFRHALCSIHHNKKAEESSQQWYMEALHTASTIWHAAEKMHETTRIKLPECIDILLECFGVTIEEVKEQGNEA